MNIADKNEVKKILKHLFVGSQLDGIVFGVGTRSIQLLFQHYSNKQPDRLYITIETEQYKITEHKVDIEKKVEALEEEEKLRQILNIRREKVVDISLSETIPHLLVSFESGKTLFINGSDHYYECWQAGDGDKWLIVAAPGNEVAFWSPDDFID